MIKHSGHLRILEKCKHSPAARVFYIFLVFSNARRVLSQCNTRLALLYLLNKTFRLRPQCTRGIRKRRFCSENASTVLRSHHADGFKNATIGFVFAYRTQSGKSHDYGEAIVSKNVNFQSVFLPHENKKLAFSSDSHHMITQLDNINARTHRRQVRCTQIPRPDYIAPVKLNFLGIIH